MTEGSGRRARRARSSVDTPSFVPEVSKMTRDVKDVLREHGISPTSQRVAVIRCGLA